MDNNINTNVCHIPVSIGELFDKYSILLIKEKKISNTTKLELIHKELNYLKSFIEKYNLSDDIFTPLKILELVKMARLMPKNQ